ncbi:MAG: o-succinylbenzoate synthase [Candidatus Zixiibacteriota bacterium]
MKTLKLAVIPYDRPLPRPITTAHGTYANRNGLLLIVSDDTGAFGVGDAAPLPGFSRDTLAQVTARALEMRDRFLPGVSAAVLVPDSFHQLSAGAAAWGEWVAGLPALQCAWETAIADLAARRQRLPLARWLNTAAATSVHVNALLHGDDPAQLGQLARELAFQGYVTFKIKAGVGRLEHDIACIGAVRNAVPGGQLRIDANGAWDQSRAATVLKIAADIRAEFVEQPLPIGYATIARRLARTARVPLALDEEADSFDNARHLIESDLCDLIVLKPMVIGGIVGCTRLATLARLRKVRVVYSSAWESDVGVAMTMHLAAAQGSGAPAAGLATAGSVGADLVDQPLAITQGQLAVRDLPGLGLNLVPGLPQLQ